MKFRIEGKNKKGKLILPVVGISNFTSSAIIIIFEVRIQNSDFNNLIKDAEEIKFKILKPRKALPYMDMKEELFILDGFQKYKKDFLNNGTDSL